MADHRTFLITQPVGNMMGAQLFGIRGSSRAWLAVEGPRDGLRLEVRWACSQAAGTMKFCLVLTALKKVGQGIDRGRKGVSGWKRFGGGGERGGGDGGAAGMN